MFPVRKAESRGKQPVKVWSVRWRVDGLDFSRRFPNAADAQARALVVGDATGLLFDPIARRFVDEQASSIVVSTTPAPGARDHAEVTIFELTERYWEGKWPSLEPKAREELARYLNRLRRFFVDAEAKPTEEACVAAYLRSGSLLVRPKPGADPDPRLTLGEHPGASRQRERQVRLRARVPARSRTTGRRAVEGPGLRQHLDNPCGKSEKKVVDRATGSGARCEAQHVRDRL